MSKFQRPDDLAYPYVYHTFTAKDEKNENIVEYRVQDLLENNFDCAVDLMMKDFITEETLCVCRGICNDRNALEEIKEFWRTALNEKISIGCYDNKNKLVGVTVLAIHKTNFDEIVSECKTEKINDIFSALFFIEKQYDIFSKYNADEYLTDYGMVTCKNFRNRGIGTEILKARIQLLKFLNLKVTSGAFTVIGSQKAALKANYAEGHSVKWSEVEEKFPAFDFSIANVDCCKIMEFVV